MNELLMKIIHIYVNHLYIGSIFISHLMWNCQMSPSHSFNKWVRVVKLQSRFHLTQLKWMPLSCMRCWPMLLQQESADGPTLKLFSKIRILFIIVIFFKSGHYHFRLMAKIRQWHDAKQSIILFLPKSKPYPQPIQWLWGNPAAALPRRWSGREFRGVAPSAPHHETNLSSRYKI